MPERCIVKIDYSQLELRIAAQYAGIKNMIEEYSKGYSADLHWKTASGVYGLDPKLKDAPEGSDDHQKFTEYRKKGKPINFGCFVGESLVLTQFGNKRLDSITLSDTVWDGTGWVRHDGLIDKGHREVIEYQGLIGTPDHLVFTDKGQVPLGYLAAGIIDAELVITGTKQGQPIPVQDVASTEPNGYHNRNYVTFSDQLFKRKFTGSVKIEKVYDLCNAGVNHRFTLQECLVHNSGYGQQAKGFQTNIRKDGLMWTLEECQEALDGFFRTYPEYRRYQLDVQQKFIEAWLAGEEVVSMETMFGRKRKFSIAEKAKNSMIGLDRYGQPYAFVNDAINHPIQGTAADMIKRAMVRADTLLREEKYDAHIILQVHDELVIDTYIPHSVDVAEIVGKVSMIDYNQAYFDKVPLITDVSIGTSWGRCVEIDKFMGAARNQPMLSEAV